MESIMWNIKRSRLAICELSLTFLRCRLTTYREQFPLLENFYKTFQVFTRIDASKKSDEIEEEVDALITKAFDAVNVHN